MAITPNGRLTAAQRRALEALGIEGAYALPIERPGGYLTGRYWIRNESGVYGAKIPARTFDALLAARVIEIVTQKRDYAPHWARITDAGHAALAEATGEKGEAQS